MRHPTHVVLAIYSMTVGCVSTVENQGNASEIQLVRVETRDAVADLSSFRPPEIVSNPGPMAASSHLRQMPQGFSGEVILEVEVLQDGSVGSVRVVRSLDPVFDRESLNATKNWLFRPARAPSGALVTSWVRLPIRFRKS